MRGFRPRGKRARGKRERVDREEIIFPLSGGAQGKKATSREKTRSSFLFSRCFHFPFKMMDYMAYERKMNSIYDMVGEGKYKVRSELCIGSIGLRVTA